MVRYNAENLEKSQAAGLPAEGDYLAEVENCEEKLSRQGQGDAMFVLTFKDVNTGEFLCMDNVMLGGRGLGIGHKKLLMLGAVDPDAREWDVNPIDLIGKRAVLSLKHRTYEGKTYCGPDQKADGFGYAPAASWNPGAAPAAAEGCPF